MEMQDKAYKYNGVLLFGEIPLLKHLFVLWKKKERAINNRTLVLKPNEIEVLRNNLITEKTIQENGDLINKTLNGDVLAIFEYIPDNLTKNFNGMKFNACSEKNYDDYLEILFPCVCKKLKVAGSLYMCGDWKCTSSV